jgi:hypothetical protein
MAEEDHSSRQDRERREEAERTLARVERDSAPLLGSALQRSSDFFSAKGESTDPAEIWGKRVGRVLAVIGAVICLVYLYQTYLR